MDIEFNLFLLKPIANKKWVVIHQPSWTSGTHLAFVTLAYPKISSITACERTPSFKERHPKFRKSAAVAAACGGTVSTASTPDYLAAARLHRQHSTVGTM